MKKICFIICLIWAAGFLSAQELAGDTLPADTTSVSREDFSTYIPPEEIENAGTVWFLSGYNTGKGPVLREDDAQIYHLWHALHASNLARQCREIQRLEEFLPSEGRWRCYLLLDADYDLLGYTMLDHQGNGG